MIIENLTKRELFKLRRSYVNEANEISDESERHGELDVLVRDIDRELLERYNIVCCDDGVFRFYKEKT